MIKLTLQQLFDKYPNLTGDEIHCVNCKWVPSCMKHFTQPTSDPGHKDTKCSCFLYWARCSICNKRMEDVGNEFSSWHCPDHPNAERRYSHFEKTVMDSLGVKHG